MYTSVPFCLRKAQVAQYFFLLKRNSQSARMEIVYFLLFRNYKKKDTATIKRADFVHFHTDLDWISSVSNKNVIHIGRSIIEIYLLSENRIAQIHRDLETITARKLL